MFQTELGQKSTVQILLFNVKHVGKASTNKLGKHDYFTISIHNL